MTVGSTQKEQVMLDSRQEEEQVTVGSIQVMVDNIQEEEQVTVEKVCHNTCRYKKLKRFLSKSKGCSDEEIYHWFTM